MATEHQFIYWHRKGGIYELDQESVANALKSSETFTCPALLSQGTR